MARDIIIRYVGDSRSAERAARNVADANDRMSRKFSGLTSSLKRFGTSAALGLAGAGVVAVKFGIDFVKAAEDSIKVSKQTNAVLESTGGVANVTAKHVADLSEELSKKAGIDDELIQSGANVLLTFKDVRDEVGKGNDIFSQATTLALDMSVAMGTDLQSSVVQVGKALNDPIRGITALRRVGVTFSDTQVAMIKKLVETGDLLGAQKLILQELTTEFEGSAEAQATASGKLAVAWDDLKEKLGTALLPWVEKFSDWLIEKGIPKVQEFAGWIRDDLLPAFGDVKVWIEENVVPPLQTMWRIFHDDLLPIFEDVAVFIKDRLVDAFDKLRESISFSNDEAESSSSSWQGWVAALAAVAAGAAIVAGVLAPLTPIIKAVGGVFGFLGLAATSAFNLIMRTLPFAHIAALALVFRDEILNFIGGAWRGIQGFFVQGGTYIADQWRQTWNRITGTLNQWWQTASAFFTALPGRLQAFFAAAGRWLFAGGKAILRGLFDGIVIGWIGWVVPWFRFIPTAVANFFIGAGKWLYSSGKKIITGLWDGLKGVWKDVKDWFGGLAGAIVDLKGPPDKDLGLLRPAGKAIMQGFFDQLKIGQGPIFKLFTRLTGFIGDFFGGGGRTSSAGLVGFAKQAMAFYHSMFPGMTIGGWRAKGSVPGSDHPKGKALDLMTHSGAVAAMIISTFRGMAGAKYWIWNRQIADARRGWTPRPYNGPSPHTDHVHLSFFQRGGIVPGPVGSPTLAVVHGGEAIFRPDQARWLSARGRGGDTNVVINVHGGNPTAVVEALRRYMRSNGPVPIRVTG